MSHPFFDLHARVIHVVLCAFAGHETRAAVLGQTHVVAVDGQRRLPEAEGINGQFLLVLDELRERRLISDQVCRAFEGAWRSRRDMWEKIPLATPTEVVIDCPPSKAEQLSCQLACDLWRLECVPGATFRQVKPCSAINATSGEGILNRCMYMRALLTVVLRSPVYSTGGDTCAFLRSMSEGCDIPPASNHPSMMHEDTLSGCDEYIEYSQVQHQRRRPVLAEDQNSVCM